MSVICASMCIDGVWYAFVFMYVCVCYICICMCIRCVISMYVVGDVCGVCLIVVGVYTCGV